MKMSKCLSCLLITTLLGCQGLKAPPFGSLASLGWPSFPLRSQSPEEDETDDEFETKVKTPMIGQYASVTGLNLIVLQGVGLVTGLNGTGGDPALSPERTRMLEDMKRRGVPLPNRILKDSSTALVIVRAYLPPLVRKGDKFDIEVRLPGSSDASSLNGGWLMETSLSETAIVPGRGVMKGHIYSKARGPILISTDYESIETRSALLRRGRVLGGGISLKDRNMALFLRNDFRSGRNTSRIAMRISKRFHQYNRQGIKEPLAVAKTDRKVELKILDRYKDNFPRYLQVIRKIAFRESEQAQHVRMQQLKKRLNHPPTAELAAIELEAIGRDAIPILKTGLKNPTIEVRFHSAVALAYLERPDGLEVLAEAVREEPAFRVFALAAMSVIDDAESNLLLQGILDKPSAETRYGAFRALTTMDKNDPYVRGENINDEFKLHVLDTQGPPLVHLTTRKKAELVLFGSKQRLVTPIAVRAGEHIRLTAPPGSDTITISRFAVGMPDLRETVPADLAEVIRTVAGEKFGASYPDVAQMLFQAHKQRNLTSRLEIDALPEAGRYYQRPQKGESASRTSQARVGGTNLTPNLFESGKKQTPGNNGKRNKIDEEDNSPLKLPEQAATDSGVASLVDVREPELKNGSQEAPGVIKRMRYGFSRFFGKSLNYVEPPEGLAD